MELQVIVLAFTAFTRDRSVMSAAKISVVSCTICFNFSLTLSACQVTQQKLRFCNKIQCVSWQAGHALMYTFYKHRNTTTNFVKKIFLPGFVPANCTEFNTLRRNTCIRLTGRRGPRFGLEACRLRCYCTIRWRRRLRRLDVVEVRMNHELKMEEIIIANKVRVNNANCTSPTN